jgi:hypothetical protein
LRERWLLGLMVVSRVLAEGGDPSRFSVAQARDAVRRALRKARPPQGRRPPLAQEWARAVKDDDDRLGSRKARNDLRQKREKPPGTRQIQSASPAEIRRAARVAAPEIRFQGTA